MTRDVARALTAALNNVPAKPQEEIEDPAAIAFLRHLEGRGIGKYLAEEISDPADDRRQALRELAQWNRDFASGKYEADRKAKSSSEAEADRIAGLSPAQRLSEALRDSAPHTDHIPLNGAAVLKAVITGLGTGTTRSSS